MSKILNNNLISRIVTSFNWLISQEYDFSFNNREIAFGIIILVFLVWMLLNKDIRKTIFNLINCLFNKYFIRAYIEIFLYCSLMISILYKVGFWNFSYTKDALLWILFSAIYLSFKVADSKDDNELFKNILSDAVGIAVVLEFLLNVYTFPIIVEVLVIVIMVFVGMMIAYTEAYPDQDKEGQVYKLMSWINIYIGLNILLFLAVEIITNFEELLTVDTLQSFLLPIIFTIMFIPYLHYLLVWTTYDKVRLPIRLNNMSDKRVVLYFKMRMYMRCRLSRKRIIDLIKTKNHLIINMKTKKDVDDIFKAI